MASANPSSESAVLKASLDPSYEVSPRNGEIFARFPSGKHVPVVRGRERAYPGLLSAAPSTLPFYQVFAERIDGKHVIDAGCGAGVGALLLSQCVAQLTALDNDARALAFGRELAPGVEFVHCDLSYGLPVDRASAAVLVDVLAHVSRPETVLRSLRACLPVGAQLFLAEAKAFPGQLLRSPARRAFSRRGLSQLLLRSGFEFDDVVCESGTFLAFAARRSDDPQVDALVEGYHQVGRSQLLAARIEFARARDTARVEIQLEALLGEAECGFALNDGDAAARAYFAATELNTKDGRALAGLARLALATGEFEDALRLALDSLQGDPCDVLGNLTVAMAAEQVSHPGAFDAWRIAANLAPDEPESATGLARLSASKQNYSFAIFALERLRAYGEPQGVGFHVTLGWLLLADGRKNDAVTEARYADALAPRHESVAELLQAATAA